MPRRCLFSYPVNRIPKTGDLPQSAVAYMSGQIASFTSLARRMNCSVVDLNWESVGVLQPDGHYDGLAGQFERNETDLSPAAFRTDQFPRAPGHFFSAGLPADVIIISRRNDTRRIPLDLLQRWSMTLNRESAWFAVITLLLVLMTVALVRVVLETRASRQLRTLVQAVVSESLVIPLSLAYVPAWSPCGGDAVKMIVTASALFGLFLVDCFMGGQMGADMVVLDIRPIIETVWEFTKDSWTQPLVFGNLFLKALMEKSVPGTELGHLKDVVYAREDNLFEIDYNNAVANLPAMQALGNSLIADILDTKRAVLLPYIMFEVGARPIGCRLLPETVKKLDYGRQMVAPGVLAPLISRASDPLLRQAFEYLYQTAIELGMLIGGTRWYYTNIFPLVAKDVMANANQSQACEEQRGLNADEDLVNFSLWHFDPVFTVWSCMLTGAVVVLMTELIAGCVIKRNNAVSPMTPCAAESPAVNVTGNQASVSEAGQQGDMQSGPLVAHSVEQARASGSRISPSPRSSGVVRSTMPTVVTADIHPVPSTPVQAIAPKTAPVAPMEILDAH